MYSDLKLLRTSNFGWARPIRVVGQAVFQNFAAGYPKFEAEREVRASPWVYALIASRLDAPDPDPGKNGGRLEAGFRWYERAGERPERTQAVGLKEWWAGLQLAERASELTAAGRRAGLPNELHPKFELAEPMAVPNPSSNPSEVGDDQPIGRH
jgi:hypothetical protein